MGKEGRRDEFGENLERVINQETSVKDLTLVITLEIRDLDALTTTEKVLADVQRESGVINPDISIRLKRRNSREQKKAFVSTSTSCAKALLKLQRIRSVKNAVFNASEADNGNVTDRMSPTYA